MKKQLVLVTGLAVLAAPAFASKARLQALGESTDGSQYINDNRNIFLNAAHVNSHKDLVTFENGTTGTADTAAAPRAEGGYFFSNGNMVYGVQLGQESNTATGLRQAGMGVAAREVNTVDLFVGGDAGVKWGASLLYSSSDNDAVAAGANLKEQNSMRARLGASQGNWDAFANISIANEAKLENGDKFEGKLGYQLGGSYMLNSYTLFANYADFTGDGTQTGVKKEVSLNRYAVGVGRATKLNDKTSLFTKVSYTSTTAENERVAAGNGANFAVKKNETTALPVVIGLEHDATAWLTLRGSIGQNVFINEVKGEKGNSSAATTVVNAGATLKFGDLSVDGVVGNIDNNGTGVNENTNAGQIRSDVLMSRVSMTYRF